MKFSVKGRIFYKNGDERDTLIEIEAEDENEAKFFFSHGIAINGVLDATVSVDLRTVKAV